MDIRDKAILEAEKFRYERERSETIRASNALENDGHVGLWYGEEWNKLDGRSKRQRLAREKQVIDVYEKHLEIIS